MLVFALPPPWPPLTLPPQDPQEGEGTARGWEEWGAGGREDRREGSQDTRAGSQDSLNSSGSVQELKHELASALAEVRAVVEEVVLLQASPELEVEELAGRPAGSREGVGRQMSGEEGREGLASIPSSTSSSRKVSAELGARSRAPTATPRSSRGEGGGEEGVVLKQSSWGSRNGREDREEGVRGDGAGKGGGRGGEGSFLRNRDLWERRTTSSTPGR